MILSQRKGLGVLRREGLVCFAASLNRHHQGRFMAMNDEKEKKVCLDS
jgi:hypothetical protein